MVPTTTGLCLGLGVQKRLLEKGPLSWVLKEKYESSQGRKRREGLWVEEVHGKRREPGASAAAQHPGWGQGSGGDR